MNPIKSIFFIVFTCLLSLTSFAQEEDEISLNNGTIDNQFEYILRKSGNFKGTNGQSYEAVKLSTFLTLRSHTIDTLKTLKNTLAERQTTLTNQTKEISELKTNLANTQQNLDKTNSEKDSMALFGMQMSKGGYNALMWTIIAGLLALLIFFIYKFKNSNDITREAKKSLAEIEEEFDEHRRIALEREQKVRRQLQDEINKQKKI
ncbi:tRNA (guanine-N1)-methyltransferase [Flavisericum labens]|uniref:tRNA (guanine-N1)-methyltransferase n=1 Tax=Flavisericum labens TaxID=3377112 RepID=UPI00387B1DA5